MTSVPGSKHQEKAVSKKLVSTVDQTWLLASEIEEIQEKKM